MYVRHKHFDYQDNEIAKDVRDPFIESLVHDTIIVQIPLLKQHREGRLFEVLSIFDQGRKDKKNGKMLNLEEGAYQGDAEMLMIVRRLGAASFDAEVQSKMDIEDEFNMAFDIREAAIAEMSGKLAERDGKIAEQDEKIAEQGEKLAEQDDKITKQGEKLAAQESALINWAKSLLAQGMEPSKIAEMTTLPVDALLPDIRTRLRERKLLKNLKTMNKDDELTKRIREKVQELEPFFDDAEYERMTPQEQDEYIVNCANLEYERQGKMACEMRGEARGIAKGKIETAKAFKAKNIPLEIIAECTGLPLDEIQKL